jgi:hypothetical protein
MKEDEKLKLSTLTINSSIRLLAERFIKSDESVELVLSIKHSSGENIEVKGIICQLGVSSEAKHVSYFKSIEAEIKATAAKLICEMRKHAVFSEIFMDEDTIVTFILGGIFDSF